MRALYDYKPEHDDELALKRGQVFTVTEKRDADWWLGVTDDGASGLFPSNYVQPFSR